MPLHAPAKRGTPLIARLGPRKIAIGTIAAMMATTTVPTMTGCEAAPAVIQAALTICPQLIAALLKLPISTLPPGYEYCGDYPWTIRGATVKICFFCSREPSDPHYVQLGCSGPYYPLYPSPSENRAQRGNDILDAGVHLSKLECRELLFSIAQGKADELRRRVEASLLMPNERSMPSTHGYRDLTLTLDGAAFVPDGSASVRAHTVVGIEGPIEEVAHYAARTGIRSLEFREGNTAWAIEVCPDFPVAAVFKNTRFVESIPLFAPGN
jgi:hypothetical protein